MPKFYKDTGGASVEHRIPLDKTMYFNEEVDNGDSGTAKTLDLTAGNKQKLILTDNCTVSFTDPLGATNFILKLVQDATGSRLATWPANLNWPGGIDPVLTTAANGVDLIGIYFDGTDYWGNVSYNLK